MTLELITTSRLKAHRACPRLQHYLYDLCVRPVEQSEPLLFGTLVHAGLEAWWLTSDRSKRLLRAIDMLRANYEDSVRAGAMANDFRLAKAEATITGYHYRWISENLETVAVEAEFVAPLINPETGRASRTFQLAGKIDAVVRDDERRLLLVEHKTSSEDITPGSPYWVRLRMDSQVSMYYAGANALGYDVHGCLYDVLQTPGQKPFKATPEADRKYTSKASKLKDGTIRPAGSLYASQREEDETPGEYAARIMESIASAPDRWFQRGMVVRLEEDLHEHQWDTWNHARSLRDAQRSGIHVRNPDACDRYHRLCDYIDVCTRVSSIDDQELFTRGDAHPELNQVAKEEPEPNDDQFANPF